jgi:hypothetical protein
MPDIGASLREARMRQRIDISEIESQTKIRAKYLRALENEEWDLLPGPTFVKSFLRTYADALGLDSRLLIEEFKLRHERPADHELLPIASAGRRERQRRAPPGIARDVLVAAVVLALVALLIVLGKGGGGSSSQTTPSTSAPGPARHQHVPATTPRPAAPALVRLRLVPTGQVWVCLQAAGGRTLIGGRVVSPTDRLPTYRSKRFKLTLGNGNLTMRIDGRTLTVPAVQDAIGYVIDRQGRRTVLPPAQRPTCA